MWYKIKMSFNSNEWVPVWGDTVTSLFRKSSSLLGEEINLDYKPRTYLFTDTKCSLSALHRQHQIRQKENAVSPVRVTGWFGILRERIFF